MPRVSKLNKLIKKLQEDFDKYLGELDPRDREMLKAHTARGRVGIEEGEFDDWESMEGMSVRQSFRSPASVIADLERIISEGPRIPEDITVYRGGPEGVARRAARWRYPISTSLDPEIAAEFALDWEPGIISRIEVPEGSQGLYPASLYDLQKQEEILLPQGEFELLERRRPRTYERMIEEERDMRRLQDLLDKFAAGELADVYRYEKKYRGGLIDGYA